jgi:hypothetical protein
MAFPYSIGADCDLTAHHNPTCVPSCNEKKKMLGIIKLDAFDIREENSRNNQPDYPGLLDPRATALHDMVQEGASSSDTSQV